MPQKTKHNCKGYYFTGPKSQSDFIGIFDSTTRWHQPCKPDESNIVQNKENP